MIKLDTLKNLKCLFIKPLLRIYGFMCFLAVVITINTGMDDLNDLCQRVIQFFNPEEPFFQNITNGRFEQHYSVGWNSIKESGSDISMQNNILNISYTGKGDGNMKAALWQTIEVNNIKKLGFSIAAMIDRKFSYKQNNIRNPWYPSINFKFLDNQKTELYRLTFTPDTLYEPEKHPTPNWNCVLEPKIFTDLVVHPWDIIKKTAPPELYQKTKFATVSLNVNPPANETCRSCSISIKYVLTQHMSEEKEKISCGI